jgi:PAS domain S-box-containing protein
VAARIAGRRRGLDPVLEASQETLSRIFDGLDDAVLIVEPHSRTILDCNPAAERMFGYRRAEMIGANTRILHRDEESYQEFDRRRLAAGTENGVYRTEFSVRGQGGEVRYTENTVILLGEGDRAFSIVRDITDRRRRSQELEESKELLQRVLDTAADGVMFFDQDGVIVFANAAAERISGKSPLCGARFDDPGWELRGVDGTVIAAEDRPVPHVLATGEPIQGAEVVFRRRDGLELRLSVNAAPVESPDGGRHGVVVTYRDVTEKRAAAEALERSESLLVQAQKMEAIGRLAGGVAHDFNNLLTAILGYCDLVAARFRKGADAEAEIGGIRRAAARAAELTAQLLAFSRQQVREPRVLDPSRVLEELAGMLRVLVGEGVALELDLTPEPLRVTIDPGQLEQVVLNLAVNARDAMPRGGRLTVESRRVTLVEPLPATDGEIPPGDFALLAVDDAGEGIPPESRGRIFEPFFTTKPVGHGTGLGLATVYGIVTQNEGFVRVESELARGSRFEVYLPLAPPEAAARADGPEEPAAASGSSAAAAPSVPRPPRR